MKSRLLNKNKVSFLLAVVLALLISLTGCSTQKNATVGSISIKELPSKIEYVVGDTFSPDGGIIEIKYSDGKTKTLSSNDEGVKLSQPDMSTAGKKTITVTYEAKTAEFEINVSIKTQVASISVKTMPTKLQYLVGQSLVPSGGVLSVEYEDGTKGEVSFTAEGVAFSDISSATAGEVVVTVTYGGRTATFVVTTVDVGEQKPVGKISIKSKPTKTDYIAGDVFDPTGGVLEVTYKDKTKEDVPFDDIRVTIPAIDMGDETMTESVSKTATVIFNGKKATFSIGISAIGGVVTFESNCEDVPSFTVKVAKGTSVAIPTEPSRSGYTFYKWYEDKNCTIEYEFGDEVIDKNKTIYAQWKKNGETYYNVTFSYNYYGVKKNSFTQIVEKGKTARPIAAPNRAEFKFEGWYTNASLTTEYDASSAIGEDMTICAKWSKTKTGSSVYVFEAENTNLIGKVGPGYSGEANDGNMVVVKNNLGASGDKAVSYLYRNGLELEFYLASSEATSAKLKVRMAAELGYKGGKEITFTQENYKITVNDVVIDYSVTLTVDQKFIDVDLGMVNLAEGANIIKLITNNSDPTIDGTYEAYAPMIDCIKIETPAVLTWDDNYGLPKKY